MLIPSNCSSTILTSTSTFHFIPSCSPSCSRTMETSYILFATCSNKILNLSIKLSMTHLSPPVVQGEWLRDDQRGQDVPSQRGRLWSRLSTFSTKWNWNLDFEIRSMVKFPHLQGQTMTFLGLRSSMQGHDTLIFG